MRKASAHRSTFAPVITHFRQIAAEASERRLLGDGAPTADADLLELCAEIAAARAASENAFEVCCAVGFRVPGPRRQWLDAGYRLRVLMRRAGKMRATTPAGIYAKAITVRAARSAPPGLCASLARDLIENARLRAMVWPPEIEPGGAA